MLYPAAAFISPGGGELIVIMLVLILLFGAKDAPRILRSMQMFLDKVQRSAADFRYKIMYGDLHQEEPNDADQPYCEEDGQQEPDETFPDTADPSRDIHHSPLNNEKPV